MGVEEKSVASVYIITLGVVVESLFVGFENVSVVYTFCVVCSTGIGVVSNFAGKYIFRIVF